MLFSAANAPDVPLVMRHGVTLNYFTDPVVANFLSTDSRNWRLPDGSKVREQANADTLIDIETQEVLSLGGNDFFQAHPGQNTKGSTELLVGRVELTWEGEGDVYLQNTGQSIQFNGTASNTPNARGAVVDGERAYDVSNVANGFQVRVSDVGAGGVRNIRLWLPDPADPNNKSLKPTAGQDEPFWHPTYVDFMQDAQLIRTLGTTVGNSNPEQDWNDRRLPDSEFQVGVINRRSPAPGIDIKTNEELFPGIQEHAGDRFTGVAWEHLIDLANDTDSDLWINVPHLATDTYITKLAQLFRYGSDGVEPYTSGAWDASNKEYHGLEPGLRVFVEYSNEVWHPFNVDAFAQGTYVIDQAQQAGLNQHVWNAQRMTDVWGLFEGVFSGQTDRIVKPAATWTNRPEVTELLLPVVTDIDHPENNADVTADFVAYTDYFGNSITEWAMDNLTWQDDIVWDDSKGDWSIDAIGNDQYEALFTEWNRRMLGGDLIEATNAFGDAIGRVGGIGQENRDLAQQFGLPIIAYEGGPNDNVSNLPKDFDGLLILTKALTTFRVDDTVDITIKAQGEDGVLDWQIVAGSLPAGLSLGQTTASNGEIVATITGTVTQAGPYSFTLRATDTNDGIDDDVDIDEWTYSDTVLAAGSPQINPNPRTLNLENHLERIFRELTQSPALGEMYDMHLNLARSLGVEMHSAFVDIGRGEIFGHFGHLFTLADADDYLRPNEFDLNSYTGDALYEPVTGLKHSVVEEWEAEFTTINSIDAPVGARPQLGTPTGVIGQILTGESFSFDFDVTGGEGARNFKFVGGQIPDGMTIQQVDGNTMRLSGAPAEAGEFLFLIRVDDTNTDGTHDADWATYQLNVAEQGVTSEVGFISSSDIPSGTTGPFDFELPLPAFDSLTLDSGAGLSSDVKVANTFGYNSSNAATLADAVANDDYISIQAQVIAGRSIDFDQIDLNLWTQNQQPRTFVLRSDQTGGTDLATWTFAAGQDTTAVSADLTGFAALKGIQDDVEFRLYIYGGGTSFEAAGLRNIGADAPAARVLASINLGQASGGEPFTVQLSSSGIASNTPVPLVFAQPEPELSDITIGTGSGLSDVVKFPNAFGFNQSQATSLGQAVSEGDYLSITVNPGVSSLDYETLRLKLWTQNSVPRTFVLRSDQTGSTDLGSWTLAAGTGNQLVTADLSGVAGLQDVAGPVEFRLYVFDDVSGSPTAFVSVGLRSLGGDPAVELTAAEAGAASTPTSVTTQVDSTGTASNTPAPLVFNQSEPGLSDIAIGTGSGLSDTVKFPNAFAFNQSGATSLSQAVSEGDYLSITVNLEPGQTISYDTLKLNLWTQNSVPRTFVLRSDQTGSTDLGSWTLDAGTGSQQVTADLSGFAALQGVTGSVEFQLYVFDHVNTNPNNFVAVGLRSASGNPAIELGVQLS